MSFGFAEAGSVVIALAGQGIESLKQYHPLSSADWKLLSPFGWLMGCYLLLRRTSGSDCSNASVIAESKACSAILNQVVQLFDSHSGSSLLDLTSFHRYRLPWMAGGYQVIPWTQQETCYPWHSSSGCSSSSGSDSLSYSCQMQYCPSFCSRPYWATSSAADQAVRRTAG